MSAGANTPPEKPAPSVIEVARIFAKTSTNSSQKASDPLSTSSTTPNPVPNT